MQLEYLTKVISIGSVWGLQLIKLKHGFSLSTPKTKVQVFSFIVYVCIYLYLAVYGPLL